MQTVRLVRRGMKGRGRDTRLLRLVLTLCFAFITMSAIVLSSTEQTKFEQRIIRHGKWQVMLYGADEAQRRAMEEAGLFPASGTLIGMADTTGQVGVIDEQYMDLARLVPEEGRLPQGEDEILLTRAAAQEQHMKTGDELRLVFRFDHVAGAGRLSTSGPGASLSLRQEYLDRMGGIEAFIPAFEAWKAEGGRLEGHLYYDSRAGHASHLTEEEKYLSDLSFWVDEIERAFYVEAQSARTQPYHEGDLTMALSYSEQRYRLLGSGFGEDWGKDVSYGNDYRSLMLTKTYTVSGIVASYTDQWAAGDFALPEAFVSADALRQIERGIARVEEDYEDLPRYAPGALLLMYDEALGARALFEKALPLFIDERRPAYRVDQLGRDLFGGLEGIFVGLDPATGQELAVPFTGYDETILFRFGEAPGTDPAITPPRAARLRDLYEGSLRVPGLEPIVPEPVSADSARETGSLALRINSFAYPMEASEVSGAMQGIMEGALSLITLAAVLQVFLTQIRRRARRIALMKALGADNGQVARMLLWEAALLVGFALPLGLALGLVLSRAGIGLMNALDEAAGVRLYVSIPSLTGGLAMGVLAVFTGMVLPLWRAVRIPLTGSFEAPVKLIRRPAGPLKRRRQTALRGVLRNARVNAGRSLGQAALSALIVLSALTSIYLGHNAFFDYRAEVLDLDRPDYELSLPYGMNLRWMRENLDRLQAVVPVLSRVDAMLSGGNVGIPAQGLEEREGSLMAALRAASSGLTVSGGPGGLVYPARVWGAPPDSEMILRLIGEIDAGAIDPEAFDRGEEAILIMPRYREREGLISYSLNPHDRAGWTQDDTIKPGEVLKIETKITTITEAFRTDTYHEHAVRIAAVIYDVALPGIWPFSGDPQPFSLVGSQRLVTRIYPQAAMRVGPEQLAGIRASVRHFYPDQYGVTTFYAYGGGRAGRDNGDVAVYNFAGRAGFDLHSWRPANEAMRSLAVNNMMLAAMLGSFVFLVAAVILSNNLGLAAEQERRRIGVLQAMGLRRDQMARAQAAWGALVGLMAVCAANLLLGLALTLGSLGGGGWAGLMQGALRGYPFLWHGLLCLAFIPLSALLHLRPLMPVLRRPAVENISEG